MRAGLISSILCLPLLTVAALAGDKGDLWSGPYAGTSIGYAWGESKQNYDRAGDHGEATLEPDGASAAITGGYNWMWDENFLFGFRLCKNARWAAPCDEVLGLDCFVASIFGLAVFGG